VFPPQLPINDLRRQTYISFFRVTVQVIPAAINTPAGTSVSRMRTAIDIDRQKRPARLVKTKPKRDVQREETSDKGLDRKG
jgi:hypothetical protein